MFRTVISNNAQRSLAVATRSIHASSVAHKSVTETVKDTAQKVNLKVGQTLASGIETGEKVSEKVQETVGAYNFLCEPLSVANRLWQARRLSRPSRKRTKLLHIHNTKPARYVRKVTWLVSITHTRARLPLEHKKPKTTSSATSRVEGPLTCS